MANVTAKCNKDVMAVIAGKVLEERTLLLETEFYNTSLE